MSVSLWAYDPEKCDGDCCALDCDICPKAWDEVETGYKMSVKLDEGARMPTRAHFQDAGLDLYSREAVTIPPKGSHVFDTGVHILFPPMHYGKIESKSGLNINHDIVSCGGVIDEGYTGSIRVKLYNLGDEPYTFQKWDKIAQLIITVCVNPPMKLVDSL